MMQLRIAESTEIEALNEVQQSLMGRAGLSCLAR